MNVFARASLGLLLLAAALCLDASDAAASVLLAPRPSYTKTSQYTSAMLKRVNEERAKHGLPPMCNNKHLEKSAKRHANDMARNDFVSDVSSDNTPAQKRIENAGFKGEAVCENLAVGTATVDRVMDGWMKSPDTRATILGNYTMHGVAYTFKNESEYYHHWVQDFGYSTTETCNDTASVDPSPSLEFQSLSAGVQPLSSSGPTYTRASQYTSAMLKRVNKERAKYRLPPLCNNYKLQRAASRHAKDMAKNDYMDHTGSDGSSMSGRVKAAGYHYSILAENVESGAVNVEAVMDDWMTSDTHRKNILSDATMMGSAYAYNSKSKLLHYWTQEFASSTNEKCDGATSAAETPSAGAPLPSPGVKSLSPGSQRSNSVGEQSSSGPTYTRASQYTSALLKRVNKERAKYRLPPLCINNKLQRAASRHAKDMAKNNYLDHTGSDGSSAGGRITNAGYVYSAYAENVSGGRVDVDAAVTGWMNSWGHRKNILGDYTMMGVAYAYSAKTEYLHYWAQEFGSSTKEKCSLTARELEEIAPDDVEDEGEDKEED